MPSPGARDRPHVAPRSLESGRTTSIEIDHGANRERPPSDPTRIQRELLASFANLVAVTMNRSSIWLGLTATLALVLGCNERPADPIPADEAPQVLAEQICEQMFSCACDNTGSYTNEAECVTEKSAEIAELMDEFANDGRSWSPQCAGELARVWSKWGCLGNAAALAEASHIARTCELTHGTKLVGEECYHNDFGDECSPDLACIDGMCRDAPTFPVPKGGVCQYDYERLPCEEDTFCGWNADGGVRYCRKPAKVGDSCGQADLECGPASMGLYCNHSTSRCETIPGVGESCASTFQCQPDAYCDGGQDMTCQARQPIGSGCSTDAVCVADARCEDNICTPGSARVCNLSYWP